MNRSRCLAATAALVFLTSSLPAADPVFPYGAVYFRKSNPPEEDWARDHATAARLGMNTFRHWFMWEAIEVAPGKRNGIKVVIAEFVTSAPNGCMTNIPTRFKATNGSVVNSGVSGWHVFTGQSICGVSRC